MKIEVGNLIRFTYDDGSNALGIVTWEEGNLFKAIWSDIDYCREMKIPLY